MNIKALALIGGIVCLANGPAHAQSETFYTGQIITTGASFCPEDFLEVDGQTLSIDDHAALYTLLGTTYGGDGDKTFALPTIPNIVTATGATVLNCICVDGVFPTNSNRP